MNDQVFITSNFIVERHPKPFVSRSDGGHLRIFPKDKERISSRSDFSSKEAIELMRLSIVSGKALEESMNALGIPVVKINYEDLGNWAFKRGEKPVFHLHIFGRSEDAKQQVFPEAVQLPDRSTGFYDNFEPLDDEDLIIIKEKMTAMFNEDKYSDKEWGL